MQETVRHIISLMADDNINLRIEFIRELIVEFLYNDFGINYEESSIIDLHKDAFSVIRLAMAADKEKVENYREKVANLLALLNIVKVKNLA